MKTDSNAPSNASTSGACASPEEMLSPQVLGERLRAARQAKGWTQEQAGEAASLTRIALLQIEAGTRSVSSLELLRLARCYEHQVEDFLNETVSSNSPDLILGRIAAESNTGWSKKDVEPIFNQLREAAKLSSFLGDGTTALPPFYQFGEPRSYKEAIDQGREMADKERKRLNLGSASIDDVAAIISCQSIWAVAVEFPEYISGLFLRDMEYGMAVLINSEHGRARRRFSYAHEYAHALVDREKVTSPTSRQNASDLVEKRANAFASEFLMPELGVWETLERWQKGAANREYSLLYDVATNEVLPHEVRNDSLTQRITASEVAVLAHNFKVSYEVAAYRLSDIGAIRRPQLEELVSPSQKDNGKQLMEHLMLYDAEGKDAKKDAQEQPHLQRQLVLLAIEALRRRKITDVYFERICHKVARYDREMTGTLLKIARSMA